MNYEARETAGSIVPNTMTRGEFLISAGATLALLLACRISSIGTQENTSRQVIEPEFKAELIDGLETYGSSEPLSEAQLMRLTKQLNSQKSQMGQDTYYGTVLEVL